MLAFASTPRLRPNVYTHTETNLACFHHTRSTTLPRQAGANDLKSTSIHSQSGNVQVRKFSGAGSDGDIMVASARAYVAAMVDG